MSVMSNPVRFIRRDVLGLTQAQLATVLKVKQASVSRWESAGRFPAEHLAAVRQMARMARADWSDSWIFDPPAKLADQAAA